MYDKVGQNPVTDGIMFWSVSGQKLATYQLVENQGIATPAKVDTGSRSSAPETTKFANSVRGRDFGIKYSQKPESRNFGKIFPGISASRCNPKHTTFEWHDTIIGIICIRYQSAMCQIGN